MSHWTTEVRFICETALDNEESLSGSDVESICNAAWTEIFWDSLELFDATYKSVLFPKILLHYYTREIGFETVGLWKLKLQTLVNEIMPYYNKLYEAETLKFNPLYDVDYSTTHEGEDSGDSTDNGTHTGTVNDAGTHGGTVGDVGREDTDRTIWNVFSDTPQGALTNVNNETYLTDARKITDSLDSDKTNTRTYNETNGNLRTYNESNGAVREYSNTNEYVEHVMGKTGGKSYSKLIMEYRESLINIDVRIINELNKLFMLVW